MKTMVVIPTSLEAENIADVLSRVRISLPEADVLVVDDSSPDGTAEIARKAGSELGQIDILLRPGRGGLGNAYRAGFERAFATGYEIVVQMDADLSHDPAALPELVAGISSGADVAIGSRYVDGGSTPDWPFRRRALSRMGNLYASSLLGLGVHDATAGYRAYRTEVLRQLAPEETKATGYGFQLELSYRAHRLGARVVEVPITFRDRLFGISKMSVRIVVEAVTLVAWWAFRDRVLAKFRRQSPRSQSPIAPAEDKADRSRSRTARQP